MGEWGGEGSLGSVGSPIGPGTPRVRNTTDSEGHTPRGARLPGDIQALELERKCELEQFQAVVRARLPNHDRSPPARRRDQRIRASDAPRGYAAPSDAVRFRA